MLSESICISSKIQIDSLCICETCEIVVLSKNSIKKYKEIRLKKYGKIIINNFILIYLPNYSWLVKRKYRIALQKKSNK